jgi:hypothetical protein
VNCELTHAPGRDRELQPYDDADDRRGDDLDRDGGGRPGVLPRRDLPARTGGDDHYDHANDHNGQDDHDDAEALIRIIRRRAGVDRTAPARLL